MCSPARANTACACACACACAHRVEWVEGWWSGVGVLVECRLSAGGNIKWSGFWVLKSAGFENQKRSFGEISIGILVPKTPF